MFCTACGVEISDEVKFCSSCGAEQQEIAGGSDSGGDESSMITSEVPDSAVEINQEAEFQEQFRRISLRDVGKAPKKIENVRFQRLSGTVLDHKRSSETHVSSYGGGGYVGKYGGKYGGNVAAAQIQSYVTTTDDFWIKDEDGNEQHISLTNKNVALRAGQKISIFTIFFGKESMGSIVALVNHSDGNVYRFSAWEKRISAGKEGTHKSVIIRLLKWAGIFYAVWVVLLIFSFKVPVIAVDSFAWGMIILVLAYPCLGAFLVWQGYEDKKKVKSRISLRIGSIVSWATRSQ